MKTNEEKDLAQEVADKLRKKFTDKLSNNVRRFEKDTQVSLHKSLQDIAKIAATSGTKWLAQPNTPGLTAGRIGDLFLDLKTQDVYLKQTKLGWVKQANLAGTPGADAKTPVKGVDYFDGKDGYTPIKGRDYFDGKDGKDAKEIEMRVHDSYIQWTREGEPWRNLISVEELKGAPGRAVRIGGGSGGASLEIGSLVTGAQPNRALFTDDDGKLTDDVLSSLELSFFGGLLEGKAIRTVNLAHTDSLSLGGIDASGVGGSENFGVLQSATRSGAFSYVKVDYDNLDSVPPESLFLIGYDEGSGESSFLFWPEGQLTNSTPMFAAASAGIQINGSQTFNEIVTDLTTASHNQLPTAEAVADAIAGVGGGGAWGSITGTLSDQTDLQTELDDLQSDINTKMELIGTVSMGSLNINFYDGSSTVSILSYVPSAAGEVLYIRTAGTADLGSGTPLTLAVGDFVIWDTHGLPSWKILRKANVLDTDGTLAANSDTVIASQKAVKTYVDNAVTGLLDFKGSTDASANPNYPIGLKGDAYVVSVAGKIGGASGKTVDVGDVYLAIADNGGGTEASVGTSWIVLEHNLQGALLSANNLSDLASVATARTNLGLAIGTDVSAPNPLATDTLWDTKGDIVAATGSNAASKIPVGSNGKVLVADSNSSNGLIYAKQQASHLFSSGGYTPTHVRTGDSTQNTNRAWFLPIVIDKRTAFDRIAIVHAATIAGAGSVVRLGLYANATDGNDYPDALITDYGTVPTDTAAAPKEITISPTLDPGLYWLCFCAQTTSGSPTFQSGPAIFLPPTTTFISSAWFFRNSVTGALPNPAGAGVVAGATNGPLVYLRKA